MTRRGDPPAVHRALPGREDQQHGPAPHRETWDLAGLAARYRAFLGRFRAVAGERPARWTPREAFALRFAFMFEFFRISWADPALPASLLPPDWPGEEARAVADRLMRALLPGAIAFADGVLARVRPVGGAGVR